MQPALLKLLIDQLVQSCANPVEVQTLRKGLLLLEGVERTFHDIRRVEAGRERAWWKVLERRHELEYLVHHPVDTSDVIKLPILDGVGGYVSPREWVLHHVKKFL